MTTTYINFCGAEGRETVDAFTQGVDAPAERRAFRRYVREMLEEYHMAGMNVYTSSRPCANWRVR